MISARPFLIALAVLPAVLSPVFAATLQLKVSENKRFLVIETGAPFFWLGDTARALFHRLNREEATRYLEDRASKGFTVIQAVALAELDGLNTPNASGPDYVAACCAPDARYALIYFPSGKPATLRTFLLKGPKLAVQWFDPRTGERQDAPPVEVAPWITTEFKPPVPDQDWVLVLETK